MSDIAAWLEKLGLGKYQEVFAENEVDFEVLPKLTEQDLKELAIPLGPRKKLLEGIAVLGADGAGAAVSKTPPPTSSQAERRQLTVMFVDLVGSTELSRQLDPEDMRELILAYQNAAAGEITRYEGHVAKYMGDGILAYFGWPRAHEDEAERALRAGLAVTAAVAKLSTPDGVSLAVRIGVATGLVVVGDLIGEGAAQEQAVVGETPNLAARLQGLAVPGSIACAASTRELAGEAFEYSDLGRHQLKGFSEPIQAFQVIRARALESRFEARQRTHTLLVGREAEFDVLRDAWRQAVSGHGRAVLVTGEAGIGKSRLTLALHEHITTEPHFRLRFQCSPFHVNSALYPFITHIEHAAGFAANDSAARKMEKLNTLLAQSRLDFDKERGLFAALLSIPSPETDEAMQLDAQQRKRLTLEALLRQFEGLAVQHPVLCVFEDVHWIDPSTLEMLERTVELCRKLALLVVVTARPEFAAPWSGQAQTTELALGRMGRSDSDALIRELADGCELPQEVHEQIIARTDGVPLFVEELTKTVLESGLLARRGGHYVLTGPLPRLAIPATLNDSLMARLDRLSAVKEVAQLGAVIGRVFTHELVAAVLSISDQELSDALARLVDAELIFRHGEGSTAVYTFKHALVQDAAYSSLLNSRRRQLHARIAEVLQQGFSADIEDKPELLAHHFTEAGRAAQAVEFWRKAAGRSAERGAHAEAIGHLNKALEVLTSVVDERERGVAAIAINLGLAASMSVTDRLDEAAAALEQAQAAAQVHGDASDLARVHYRSGNLYFLMARGDECLAQHERSLHYAQAAGSARNEARALGGLGDAHYLRGRMITAFGYYDRCVTLSREHGLDLIEAAKRPMLAFARSYRNELTQAVQDAKASAERAIQLGYLSAEMMAYSLIADVCTVMSRLAEAQQALERSLLIAKRIDARRFEARNLLILGEIQWHQGRAEDAVATLTEAYAISREGSLAFTGPWIMGNLAQASLDPQTRANALRQGEELLRQECVSHCYFWFYRGAIEATLGAGEWDEVDRYADALARYTQQEPLPWTDFHINRGRALAAVGRGRRDEELLREVRRLREEAAEVGFMVALPALEQALSAW